MCNLTILYITIRRYITLPCTRQHTAHQIETTLPFASESYCSIKCKILFRVNGKGLEGMGGKSSFGQTRTRGEGGQKMANLKHRGRKGAKCSTRLRRGNPPQTFPV